MLDFAAKLILCKSSKILENLVEEMLGCHSRGEELIELPDEHKVIENSTLVVYWCNIQTPPSG